MYSFIAFLLIVPIVAALLLAVNALLSVSRPDIQKLSVFECGLGTRINQTRAPFDVAYYLVAILFLLFDLEILILVPIGVSLSVIGPYGFWIGIIFLAVLTLGFVIELSYGVLYFAPSINNNNLYFYSTNNITPYGHDTHIY